MYYRKYLFEHFKYPWLYVFELQENKKIDFNKN